MMKKGLYLHPTNVCYLIYLPWPADYQQVVNLKILLSRNFVFVQQDLNISYVQHVEGDMP